MDPTKYNKVIRIVLSSLNIVKEDRQDYTQECYLELLRQEDALKNVAPESENQHVGQLCKTTVIDLLRAKSRKIHAYSLDDPRTRKEATQLPEGVKSSDLRESINSLPPKQKTVIQSIFVEGKTQEETAHDLGMTRKIVRNLMDKGIVNLKNYFGETE